MSQNLRHRSPPKLWDCCDSSSNAAYSAWSCGNDDSHSSHSATCRKHYLGWWMSSLQDWGMYACLVLKDLVMFNFVFELMFNPIQSGVRGRLHLWWNPNGHYLFSNWVFVLHCDEAKEMSQLWGKLCLKEVPGKLLYKQYCYSISTCYIPYNSECISFYLQWIRYFTNQETLLCDAFLGQLDKCDY